MITSTRSKLSTLTVPARNQCYNHFAYPMALVKPWLRISRLWQRKKWPGAWFLRSWQVKEIKGLRRSHDLKFIYKSPGGFHGTGGPFRSCSAIQRKFKFLRVIPILKHYSDIVSDRPSGNVYGIFIRTSYLTFYLAYTLTFYLTFYLVSILSYFLVCRQLWQDLETSHLAGGEKDAWWFFGDAIHARAERPHSLPGSVRPVCTPSECSESLPQTCRRGTGGTSGAAMVNWALQDWYPEKMTNICRFWPRHDMTTEKDCCIQVAVVKGPSVWYFSSGHAHHSAGRCWNLLSTKKIAVWWATSWLCVGVGIHRVYMGG